MIFITHDFVLFMHLSYYLPDSKLSIFYTTTHLKSALYWMKCQTELRNISSP